MDGADLALTAVRGVHLAASLSAFGVAVFWSFVAPRVLKQADDAEHIRIDIAFRRLFHASLVLSFIAAIVWLAGEAAIISEAESMSDAAAAIWPALSDTGFGHVLALRLALLALSSLAMGRGQATWRRAVATGVIGLMLILQTWATHAVTFEMADRAILLAAGSLHLLAAGAWLGSLVPLFIMIGVLPDNQGARTARRFSPIGALCVIVLVGTALAQGWILIGSLADLLGTGYGLVALAKVALLLVLLGLAVANRFRHAPALDGPMSARARAKVRLRMSIGLEVIIGLTAVLAAALLSDLPPRVRGHV